MGLSSLLRIRLELVVFVCGAVVMILELVGSRILAPHLGSSIVVWTSLIGLILGCLSLGYWLGGRASERRPTAGALAWVILGASAAVFATSISQAWLLPRVLSSVGGELKLASILAVLLLFAPASTLLGMVSPYAVKLKLLQAGTEHPGRTAGNLYAISTLGSIVGTFLAGFVLIPGLGSSRLLLALGLSLALAALLLSARAIIGPASVLAALGTGIPRTTPSTTPLGRIVADIDTEYQRLVIAETELDRGPGQKPFRLRFYTSGRLRSPQSVVNLDYPALLHVDYLYFFRLSDLFVPRPSRALMVGGGALVFPGDFLRRHAEATMDVVELDPAVTSVASRYFGWDGNERARILHEDGRAVLNRAEAGSYDVIFVDAFVGEFAPFQLGTVEAIRGLRHALKEDGVVLANVLSSVEGPTSKMLWAELAAYRQAFSSVRAFGTAGPLKPGELQNIVIVARDPAKSVDSDPAPRGPVDPTWRVILEKELPLDRLAGPAVPLPTDDRDQLELYQAELAAALTRREAAL